MSTNLFSFLEDDHDDDLQGEDEPMIVEDARGSPSLKRKAQSPPTEMNGKPEDTTMDEDDSEALKQKKARMGSPKPVVLDDFETEAKREVAASAGLTGSAVQSGSRLELRHQVRKAITLVGMTFISA